MLPVLKTVAGSAIIAVLLLAGLSVAGFPTQRLVDAGAALNYRLIQPGSSTTPAQPAATSETAEQELAGEPKLVVPPKLYTVEGQPVRIYYDNLVLSRDSEQYRFSVFCGCDFSDDWNRRWWQATPPAAGETPLALAVSDLNFQPLDKASTVIRTAPRNAGAGGSVRMLLVGDSITRQGWWPNYLARRLDQPGNPDWTMIGRTYDDGSPPFAENTLPGVRHEGEYGWSFTFFATFNEPSLAQTYHREKSPFVFKDASGANVLDVSRYYAEEAGGQPADFVVLQLGLNDVWGTNPDDPVQLEANVRAALDRASDLIAAFHKASPDTQIGIMLPAPFSRSDRTFQHSYGTTVTRWNARRVQHELVKKMIERFGGSEGEGVWLLPVQAALDPIDGYPIDNAGHPNEYGHKQMADVVYAWMKWVLHSNSSSS